MNKISSLLLVSLTLLALTVLAPISVTAALANVSHSYKTEGNIPNGSLVSLDPSKVGYVELSSTANGSHLAGVATNANDSLLAVNPSSDTTQVVTSGDVNVLTSTVNGNISAGDQISVSPFNGIGMKAIKGSNVIGLAQNSLTSNSTNVEKEEIKNKQGKLTQISVGYVSLTIDLSVYQGTGGTDNLNSLQRFVENITGRYISTFRIIASIVITCIVSVALLVIVYAAIYSTIISVGRNPLAKKDIYGTLKSVVFMTLLVASVAFITVYLLLS